MRSHLCVVVPLMLVGLSGCGKAPGPKAVVEKVVPVAGTLTYKGQPLEYFQVTFLPVDGRRPAIGVTDAAGKFKLGTNKAGDGAPPGASKVAIVFVGPPSNDPPGQEKQIEDPALLPQPKIKIPDKYNNPETSGLTQDIPKSGLPNLKIDLVE